MSDLDFGNSINLLMKAMRYSQCHPDIKFDKYWALKTCIFYGTFTTIAYILIFSLKIYLQKEDYLNAFRIAVPVTFYICMTFYYVLMIKYRATIGSLIVSMKSDYEAARSFDGRRKRIVIDYAEKGKLIMKLWFWMETASIGVFLTKSVVLMFYYTYNHGKFTLVPFYEMHYPLNIDELRTENYFVFAITYALEFNFTATSAIIYFCSIALGIIFILHACGQLELIKLKFEDIFEKENVEENLKDIITSLQYVYSFVDKINQCFTLMYEILLKQGMLLLPFTSFAIIQSLSKGDLSIEYALLFVGSLFTSSIPCYYGDLLMEKGEEVRMTAYSCGWERVYLPSARKTLLIILTRALKPVAIKSIFCIICLDTLTNVYRQSYTIFNLMSVARP